LSSPAFPCFFHKLIISFASSSSSRPTTTREITKEEIASRSPPPLKRGRREDDDDESRLWRKLEKGEEPATKDADEEPFFDDTKFAVNLLRSAF
jgi:hypothetical protein